MATSRTKRSTPRLSEVARHCVYPKNIVTTGWPQAKAQLSEMGVTYDAWQEGIGQIALGKRADGVYASTVGGITLSIPRQTGKTFFVGTLVFALCILFRGLTVVWTAHHTRTSTKTFQTLQNFAKRKRVKPFIRAIRTANGEQEIRFVNGSVIMFGAREQGFGRGFDAVDVEVFDEAQILTEKALDDMVPAANQSTHIHRALIFYMGTPPKPENPGEAFTLKRARALDGKLTNGVYVEFSADSDSDRDDRSQWPVMNPSYPSRTPLDSMLRMRENLGSDESWDREARGIWDPVNSGGVIPSVSWADQEDAKSIAVDRFALGVEVGPNLSWASISLVGQRADGDWHAELVEDQHTKGRGVDWLIPFLEDLLPKNPQIREVVIDVSSPIAALVDQRGKNYYLKGTRIRVHAVKVQELGIGCSQVLSNVVTGSLWHIGQPQLSGAALVAGKRALGDTGMWVWSRKSSESDITPVQAMTYALVGAQSERPSMPVRDGSVHRSSRRVVVHI